MSSSTNIFLDKFIPYYVSEFDPSLGTGDKDTLKKIIDRSYSTPISKEDYKKAAALNASFFNLDLVDSDTVGISTPSLSSYFTASSVSSVEDKNSPYGTFSVSKSGKTISVDYDKVLDKELESKSIVYIDGERIKFMEDLDIRAGNFWDESIKSDWLESMANLYLMYSHPEGLALYFTPTIVIGKCHFTHDTNDGGRANIIIPSSDILDVSYSSSVNGYGSMNFSLYVDRKRHAYSVHGLATTEKEKYMSISPGDYVELQLSNPHFDLFFHSHNGTLVEPERAKFFVGMVSGITFAEEPTNVKLSVTCVELGVLPTQEAFFRLRTALTTKYAEISEYSSVGISDNLKMATDELRKSASAAKTEMQARRQLDKEYMYQVWSYQGNSRDVIAKLYKQMFLTNRLVGDRSLVESLSMEIEPDLSYRKAFIANIVTMEATVYDFLGVYAPPPWFERYSTTYWHAPIKNAINTAASKRFAVLNVSMDVGNPDKREDIIESDEMNREARLVYRRNPMTPGLQAALPTIDIRDVDLVSQSTSMYDVLNLFTCFTVNMTGWKEYVPDFFTHPVVVLDYLAQRFGYKLMRAENNMFFYSDKSTQNTQFMVQALFDCVALAKNEVMKFITETGNLKILFNPFILPGMRVRWNAGKSGKYLQNDLYSGYVSSVSHSTENGSISTTELTLEYVCPDSFLNRMEKIIDVKVPEYMNNGEARYLASTVTFDNFLFDEMFES